MIKKSIPGLLGIALPIVSSLIIFMNYEEPKSFTEVVVIQPNIDPYEQKYAQTNEDFKSLLIDLSNEHLTTNTSYLITPETYFTEGIGFSWKCLTSDELVL